MAVRRIFGASGAAVALVAALPALAQGVPQPVGAAPPTREELDPSRRAPLPTRPRLSVEGEIERSACALDDPAYAAIRITLSDAVFNNLGPVDPAEIASLWRPLAGREQPISVVCEIRDAVATALRARGYIAAVQVPAQRIEGGVVRFEVLYARLTALRVRGDAGRDEALVARYLSHIATGQVFNRRDAERYLLLARDIPGLDVRLQLKPAGTAAGEMIGEVAVRRTPIEADATIQNYAPSETGPWAGQLRAQIYGLTGLGDRTMVSGYSSFDFGEQQVVQVAHDFAAGGQGLRLGGRFTYGWTHPSLGPAADSVRARSLFGNFEASYPFVRRQAGSLVGAIGFDYVDQDVTFRGLPLSQDRLRVVYARLDADAIDLVGRGPGGAIAWHLAGSLELRQGVGIFGASPNCLANLALCATIVPPSIVGGDPQAFVARFNGLAEWRFARAWTLALLPRGQIASAAVLAFEQFSAGNFTVGRGYEPGALTGQSGAGFQAELRLDSLSLSMKHRIAVQPFAFIDSDWVWNRAANDSPRQLASVGGGARLGVSDRLRVDFALAVPLRDAGQTRAGDVRALLSVTARLWPWKRA
ncbi:hypothetical protein IP88_09715 [alpha proteobacterium AAP81b]|nr:hypothetical protein IP88_09715 [alpha proteobacterium AAP81b]